MAPNKDESQGLLLKEVNASDPEDPAPDKPALSEPWLQSFKGILAGFMLVVCHIVGVTNVQLLQRRIPDLELQVFRCTGVVAACVVWMLVKQRLPRLSAHDMPAMLLYGLVVTLDSTAVYVGFALIPATAAQCSLNTFSLLSGLYIFWLCGKEKFQVAKLLLVMICIVGVIFVIQPWHGINTKPAIETPMLGSNFSKDCVLHMEKLCSSKNGNDFKFNSISCNRKTLPEISSASGPCEILRSWTTEASHSDEAHFTCWEWLSCWFELPDVAYQPNMIGGITNNETTMELFQLHFSQTYSMLIGNIFAGLAGITLTLTTLVFQRYSCLYEDRMRSLFWSFFLGLTCRFTLTFVVESPVWPQSYFDAVAVFIHSVASVGVWIFLVYSMQCISGTTVNIIFSSAVVFFFIPQYTVLSSMLPGQKNWMEVVGFGSNWICVEFFAGNFTKQRQHTRESKIEVLK